MEKTSGPRPLGLKVAIVAEHASARFGGEAVLPLHYFRILRQRGVDVWLVSHQRTEEELRSLFPDAGDRLVFIPDQPLQKLLWRLGRRLPGKVSEITTGWLSHLSTQLRQRRALARLIEKEGVDVVHEPIPVSPRTPSLTWGLGVPVIVGPMNGGMEYPPGFAARQKPFERYAVWLGRLCSDLLNRLLPGKLRADLVLVANERTRRALPAGVGGRVVTLVENGVDLALWQSPPPRPERPGQPVRFIFLGRLVDWKAVDILIEAFAIVASACREAELHIVGDGPERARLQAQAALTPARGRIRFHGFVPQAMCPNLLADSDAMVLPSLVECGGAVVLEAMAVGIPVVATDWGGPADYLDAGCGILVQPVNREVFRDGLAEAMYRLARDPGLRRRLGEAGREKVAREFDWQKKADAMLEFYRQAVAGAPANADSRLPARLAADARWATARPGAGG